MAKSNEENNRLFNEGAKRRQEAKDLANKPYKSRPNIGGPGGGGGGMICFPSGTMIQTPYGDRKISDIADGDIVMSFDLQTQQTMMRRVLSVVKPHPSKILILRFADGSVIRTTPRHSLLVGSKWTQASGIKLGDAITSFSRGSPGEKRIVATNLSEGVEPVYNLIVERDFNFIADGVLAHSFTYCRALYSFAWSCYDRLSPKLRGICEST